MKARIWRDETLGAEFDDVEIPAELLEQAKEYREKMIEAVAEYDDHLLEKYLEGEDAHRATRCVAGIRKATIALKIFPVICGSAFKNKGVQNLLDAVVDYLPSPLDIPPVEGTDVDDPDKTLVRASRRQRAVLALVFKIMTDPFVGQLAFLRVYSGKLKTGDIGLQRGQGPQASASAACEDARQQARRDPGDSGGRHRAAVGLKTVSTGDTICDEEQPIVAGVDRLPDAGDSAGDRAEDQGRPGKAGHGDRRSWRRKIRRSG